MLALQRALVWLIGASVAIVFIEPSPYELVTLLAAVLFFATGLRLRLVFMPLLLLIACSTSATASAPIPCSTMPVVCSWIVTSWYWRSPRSFFATVLGGRHRGAARHASTRGCVDRRRDRFARGDHRLFHASFPAGHDLLLLYDRARGTFKDPNVLGAFLIFPTLLALQPVIIGTPRRRPASGVMLLGLMAPAILLSFSRAAWGQIVYTAVFMLALTF